MLSNSMFLPGGDRQLLQQKVFILQQELQQYKMKQSKLSKLNESILQTYKLNQTIKQTQEQQTKKENRQLITKHRQEIRKLKTQFTKDKSQLQTQNLMLKQKLKSLEDTLERTKLQHQRNLIDIKTTMENKHQKNITEIETKHNLNIKNINEQMDDKIQQLEKYIEELQHQNQLFQEYIQRKQDMQKENIHKRINTQQSIRIKKSNQIQTKNEYIPSHVKTKMFKNSDVQSPLYTQMMKQRFYDQKVNDQKYQIKTVPKESKKLISELGTRINNAIKEINQNKYHHHY